jgi:hypothetical protein
MSGKFGWSLPPGVSQRDIDEAYGVEIPEPTCEHPECWAAYNDEDGDGTYPCLDANEPDPDEWYDRKREEESER